MGRRHPGVAAADLSSAGARLGSTDLLLLGLGALPVAGFALALRSRHPHDN